MITQESIHKKASSLKGCLAHLRTETGRRRYDTDEDPLTGIDPFISDIGKIVSSKAVRNMPKKTQVFTLPGNALVRNRNTHVQEVVGTSIVLADLLGLNVHLVQAAAQGHDIGHIPLGHQGEAWLAKVMGRPFCHEVMGPVVMQHIERAGKGLNLTFETLDGMMRHSGNMVREGMTPEAWLLRYTDKITYLFHDVNDIVVREGYSVSEELTNLVEEFGSIQRFRASTAMAALTIESAELGRVSFEYSDLAQKFHRLRRLMYDIYPCVTQQDVGPILEPVLRFLERLDIGDPFMLLALLNDEDAIKISRATMRDMRLFNETSLSEIVEHLPKIGKVDLCDPDLNW